MPRFVASTVRELRRKTGLSQRKFADLIGVSYVTVNRWETGQYTPECRAQDDLAALALQYEDGEVVADVVQAEVVVQQCEPVHPILRATGHFPERVLVALSAEQLAALLDALLEGDELDPLREKTVLRTYDELAAAYVDLTGTAHDAV